MGKDEYLNFAEFYFNFKEIDNRFPRLPEENPFADFEVRYTK